MAPWSVRAILDNRELVLASCWHAKNVEGDEVLAGLAGLDREAWGARGLCGPRTFPSLCRSINSTSRIGIRTSYVYYDERLVTTLERSFGWEDATRLRHALGSKFED